MQRPRIGLNMDVQEDDKGISFLLRSRYAQAIQEAGGRPALLPPLPGAEPAECLEGLHGLLLTGGDDLSPTLYGGGERMPEEVPLHPQREQFDLELVRAAIRGGLPLLAVCLGIQELCVACGGALHPFIPSRLPGAMAHRAEDGAMTFHPLEVEEGSRLAGIIGSGPTVNSGHRQAVSRPGRGLRVTARAPDGVIEAVEAEGGAFILGVQWHPELMGEDPNQKKLFSALVEAARPTIFIKPPRGNLRYTGREQSLEGD